MTPSDRAAPGPQIARLWLRLSRLPGGRRLFSRLLGRFVPYSGTIRPFVLELGVGHAIVELRERRALRNHLRSVHAIALANLGELASGLAMALALPPDVRGIPVRLEIDYLKKARGRLVCTGSAAPPAAIAQDTEAEAHAEISDLAGDVVARVVVSWRLSPLQA